MRQLSISSEGESSTTIALPRLDGHFQFCNIVEWSNHSPQDPTAPFPTNGASILKVNGMCSETQASASANLKGFWAFVDLNEKDYPCSVEMLAKNVILVQNATSVVFMAKRDTPLFQIGQDAFEQNGIWNGNDNQGFCSMVAYDPQLGSLFKDGSVNTSLVTTQQSGGIVIVDSSGKLREAGALLNPSLSILAYAAQEVEYKAQLQANLTQPALVIPVFTDAVGEEASVTISIPSKAILQQFNHLDIEATMTCSGMTDLDCDKWDHVHSVSMVCTSSSKQNEGGKPVVIPVIKEANVSPNEIARYITPYRRRVGHWLTSASLLFNTLDDADQCIFKLVATDNGSPWVFGMNLRVRNVATPSFVGRPFKQVLLFNSTILSTFDNTYNNRPILSVSTPPATKSVYINALITGHGTMEFTPSKHVFTVNGMMYNTSFMDPLDQNGCAKKVAQGVEANGHGAFEFGRDGWCNGWHVPPLVIDVTDSIHSENNEIRYAAFEYVNGEWIQPEESGGEMRLSSAIVFLN
eukprot:m.58155 g.58155  ORF g.58155 m.58155 type:complete len:522 (+) comp7851_c5_seq2:694-2259(+)